MLGGGKKHEQNTKQDTLSLFLQWEYKLGTQPSMEHSHNGVFVVFFQSVCFLYKRILEERHQKPVTINAVKGDFMRHTFGKNEQNAVPFSPLKHIPVIRKAKQ